MSEIFGAIMPLSGRCSDQDFKNLLGDQIGTGTARDVYECIGCPDYVIKKSKSLSPHLSNIIEWWIGGVDGQVKETSLEPLFAKCVAISETGMFLMMEKLRECPPQSLIDNLGSLPEWLTDRGPKNFGIDNEGKLKCLDYGRLKLGDFLGTAYDYAQMRRM